MTLDGRIWIDYAEALAFAGNSLLAPMRRTPQLGIEPGFWGQFPDFDDRGVREAIAVCRDYAVDSRAFEAGGGDPIQRASVEYTKLFIGPPRPAAAPWETIYRAEGDAVGFGAATFEMRGLLREAGLEVSNANNQYADHIGIELLYASVACGRLAEMENGGEAREAAERLAGFLEEHPLSWIGKLRAAVAETAPGGYIAAILGLSEALSRSLRARIVK